MWPITVTASLQSPLASLLGLQRTDGGFGARAGLPSATEPTALAAFALSYEPDPVAQEAAGRAALWLAGAQTSDGGWPSAPNVGEAGWGTALAVLALSRFDARRDIAMRGATWLLGREGRRTGWKPSLLDRLLGRTTVVTSDDSLVGWPWLADTYSWVEPTSYAILALERLRAELPPADVARRIDVGRRMIRDRICPDGTWNYGSAAVYGQGLWGYPDTTALALLALRGDDPAAGRSLDALEQQLAENQSGLATALGVLALDAYGRDVAPLRDRLRDRFPATGFLGETRAISFAVLALNRQAHAFGEPPRA
jgi:hypothetical protein